MINANEIRAVLIQCGSWRKARHLGQQCDEMTPGRLTDLLDTLTVVGFLQHDARQREYVRTVSGSEWLEMNKTESGR